MSVYTIDFDTMLDELASRLEVPRSNPYFTEAEMKRWINLGIIEMAKRTKLVHAVRFLWLSASVNRYTAPEEWLNGQSKQVLYLETGVLTGNQYPLHKTGRRITQSNMGRSSNNVLSAGYYNTPDTGPPTAYMIDGTVIEFQPIPTAAAAGSNKICFKFAGIPDQLSATSAVPGIPLEYRLLPVTFAEHLGQKKSKDIRATATLQQFWSECETANGDVKWGDQEDPPTMYPEDHYQGNEHSII